MNTTKGFETRQRILEHGLELVSQEGFAGVSIGRLAEGTRLSKSGLFAHFGSLESLYIALLRHAVELARKDVMEVALRQPSGLPQLQTYFERLLGWAKRSGLPGGCPFVSASSEFDDVEGPVRDYVVETLNGMLEFFTTLIKDAVAEKHLRKTVDANYLAWQLLGIYSTHHIMQRLMRDAAADETAKKAFKALLEPYVLLSKERPRSKKRVRER
jgi:AcrR family transcriptional regulator